MLSSCSFPPTSQAKPHLPDFTALLYEQPQHVARQLPHPPSSLSSNTSNKAGIEVGSVSTPDPAASSALQHRKPQVTPLVLTAHSPEQAPDVTAAVLCSATTGSGMRTQFITSGKRSWRHTSPKTRVKPRKLVLLGKHCPSMQT